MDSELETRSSSKIRFDLPRLYYEKFKSFPLYRGSKLWDTLPQSIQNTDSYLEYKNKIRKYLWQKGYPPWILDPRTDQIGILRLFFSPISVWNTNTN